MSIDSIPAWSSLGVLPPVAHGFHSPYLVTLEDFLSRFGVTPERQAMLEGFLRFRNSLHSIGLIRGFQWVDGSFLEDIETSRGRNPKDIDVVTFFHLPAKQTPGSLLQTFPCHFDRKLTKVNYSVDAYFVELNDAPESLVNRAAYWYSLWSHTRNEQWKGFIQVDLSPEYDQNAMAAFYEMTNKGGKP